MVGGPRLEETVEGSINKYSSLSMLEEKFLTKKEVRKLCSYAVKGAYYPYVETEEWQKLRDFVSEKFNVFGDFADDEVEILTFLLQYSLLNLTSEPMRKLGRHKRKTGRLTPAHSIDLAQILVEGFRRYFKDLPMLGRDERYSGIIARDLTSGRKLTYKHIAGALLHDLPEDTFGTEGEVTLEEIAYNLITFISENESIKDKERYIRDVKHITYIVQGLTKYQPVEQPRNGKLEKILNAISISESENKEELMTDVRDMFYIFNILKKVEPVERVQRDYYEFTKGMIEKPEDPDLLEDMMSILQIKGGDNVVNTIETIHLEKNWRHRAYISLRDIIIGRWEDRPLVERLSRGRYKGVRKIARFRDRLVEKISKKPWIERLGYWMERDRAMTGPEKLLNYFKSFRVVDVFNIYMNEHGFDSYLFNVKRLILESTGERIRGRAGEIIKYECAGFDRTYLDKEPENVFEQIEGLVYENENPRIEKKSWLEKEIRKGERLASLGVAPEEILETPEIILDYKVLEYLYLEKLKKNEKAEFDVFDKIVLDKKFENYRRSGNLFRRTRKQRDPIKSPFNILETDYDRFVAGDKEKMRELQDNKRTQYVHLLDFGGLIDAYLRDMFEDKEHGRPKINIDGIGNIIEKENYLTFNWGVKG